MVFILSKVQMVTQGILTQQINIKCTGNNRISYNAALEVLNSANYVTGKGTGSLVNGSANISSSLANSNITWEQTDEFNYGLDLGLFILCVSSWISKPELRTFPILFQ